MSETSKDRVLVRDSHEKIKVTITGLPEDEWFGIDGSDVWWILTDDEEGGDVLLKKHSDDSGFTVEQTGGGGTDAIVTIELVPADTTDLPRIVYQEIVVQDANGEISADNLEPHQLWVQDSSASEVP